MGPNIKDCFALRARNDTIILMKIIYDEQVDALYVKFVDTQTKVITHQLTEDIAINYGAKGDVVGIEVLSAHEHLKFIGKKPRLEAVNLAVN